MFYIVIVTLNAATDVLAVQYGSTVVFAVQIAADTNDAQHIMNMLSVCCSDWDVLRIFSSIQGPWAFVFLQVGMSNICNVCCLAL